MYLVNRAKKTDDLSTKSATGGKFVRFNTI